MHVIIQLKHLSICSARASLYPGISCLRPTMMFECSDSLLIAWGDCLMNMKINNSSSGDGVVVMQSSKNFKRTVKCAMAWQLDCVACGVAPVDAEHVAVLGLVPGSESEDGVMNDNVIEMQMISRSNGTVVQSDVLPLIRSDDGVKSQDSTLHYTLNSSFATPRMEDVYEVQQEELITEEVVDFDIQTMLNTEITTPFRKSSKAFVNPHMKWDVATYNYVINCEDEQDDASSLESDSSDQNKDDLSFLFRDLKSSPSLHSMLWSSPMMSISSLEDAVLVQTRDVDDSISHARSLGNYGVALRRGLGHRQIIRRHDLNDLIDDFLGFLLFQSNEDGTPALSLSRLKSAAKVTETLFGANIHMWEKWIHEFAKIPGALFLLEPHIPTRGKQHHRY